MRLLFISKSDPSAAWREHFDATMPEIEMRVWPDAGDPAEIDAALVWKPKPGVLASFPNLKLIQSLGMGVDHIFNDPDLPAGVPIARMVDPGLVDQMSEYILFAVLRHYRRMDDYDAQQRAGEWREHRIGPPGDVGVGILGLGTIGQDAGAKLDRLGFSVAGWSRSAKDVPGIESVAGDAALDGFLARSDVLVCVLPLTPETQGILNAETFAKLPKGAYVINVARGGHLVEADLLAAIDEGHLSGATLDVFETEPLPATSPLWSHPKVHITPHIAGLTNASTAAEQVVENLRRVRDGQPPLNQVDPKKGY